MKTYFVVKYSGPFGFIKPWTAVRDGETFSQQFLTPSIVEGLEKKLFPELLINSDLQGAIIGHRLNYTGISVQQEQTWSKAWSKRSKTKPSKPETGILNRGVLISPELYLAFSQESQASRAVEQHICLCRNEDVMLPESLLIVNQEEWLQIPGYELIIEDSTSNNQFKVGYNRFKKSEEMYGRLISIGDPIRKREI